MYGSTRTIHGTYQGFCRLEFYDSFLELHFPSFMSYHEKIDYCNIKHIFCNSDYSKIKIIYTQSNKTHSVVFISKSNVIKNELKANIHNFKSYHIKISAYRPKKHGLSRIPEYIRFWILLDC